MSTSRSLHRHINPDLVDQIESSGSVIRKPRKSPIKPPRAASTYRAARRERLKASKRLLKRAKRASHERITP